MKYCPTCQTQYTDDTLQFCLQDGARLSAAGQSETETVVLPRQVEPLRVEPFAADSSADWRQSEVTRVSAPAATSEPKKRSTFLIVALTAGATVLLLGAIGAGAWLYLKNGPTEIVKNTNGGARNAVNQNFANNSKPNSNAEKKTPPSNSANSAISNVFPNASPAAGPTPADGEQIRREISAQLESWKYAAEARNLNGYMNNYAGTVDYYNKGGASADFVRRDKQRAFTKFDLIRFDLGNVTITPDASGSRVVALFDKAWQFSGADGYSEGKVRQQLTFEKIGGRWLITGEKDLKVYYIE